MLALTTIKKKRLSLLHQNIHKPKLKTMDGLRVVLLVIAILILIVNFIINLTLLTGIIRHCFRTNSLAEYWTLFFKNGLSGRAIISSIIATIMAFALFLVILPFVLLKRFRQGKREAINEEFLLQYSFKDITKENKTFHTNITDVGLAPINCNATGNIRVDATMVMAEILAQFENEENKPEYKVGQEISVDSEKNARIPIMLKIGKKEYPIYFLYDSENEEAFEKIQNKLYYLGFKKCIYFSVNPVKGSLVY